MKSRILPYKVVLAILCCPFADPLLAADVQYNFANENRTPAITGDTGGVTLSNVRRGVAQMGSLGYWIGQPHARRGYTLAGVKAVCRFAFQQLGLHRVEAACLPQNAPSAALLLKAGFEEEGFARAYLKIDGDWRDHRLFGLLSPELQRR